MKLNKDTTKQLRRLILFTVLLFLGIQRFDVILLILSYIRGILFPFLLGLCFAFLLNMPMRFIERTLFSEKKKPLKKFLQKIKRPISLVISVLLVLGVIAIVMIVIVPELISTGETLYNSTSDFVVGLQGRYNKLLSKYAFLAEKLGDFEIDWGAIRNALLSFIKNDLITTLSSTVQVAKNIVGTMFNIIVAIFFSVYVLLQKEKLGRQCKAVLSAFFKEKTTEKILRIVKLADVSFTSFFSGQCIEAVIMGILFVITMTIFGFPYAVMVGVLIAFTALIPIFGPMIGCAISALLILTTDPMQAVWFVVMFFALQLLEENLIYPYVVGNAVGLSPIWVLVAVTIGGSMFGIVGMLFFIPLTSVIYTLFREIVYDKVKKKRERGDLPPKDPNNPLLEMDAKEKENPKEETLGEEDEQTPESDSEK